MGGFAAIPNLLQDPDATRRLLALVAKPGQPVQAQAVLSSTPNPGLPTAQPLAANSPTGASMTPGQYKSQQAALAALPTPNVVPASGMGGMAAVPNLGAPTGGPVAVHSQAIDDSNRLDMLKNTGAGVDQIKNPWLRGFATVGDVALSELAPRLAQGIPGTELHHQMLLNQQNAIVDNDQTRALRGAQIGDADAQAQQRAAQGYKADAQADDLRPFVMSVAQAAALNHPELAGTQATMRDYNRALQSAGNNNTSLANNQNTNSTKVTTTGMNNATAIANNGATNASHESIAAAADKTRTLVAQMHDATSRANNANTNATSLANNQNTNNHRSGGGDPLPGGGFKVPADVTKRAALASNVTENANSVDQLLQQHPDMVGSVGGRFTSVQQMIGSDDPAIAEMGVRMHNIALASNGAHGVRSSEAIAQTENELFNHFKSGPEAIHGALNATRSSMQTFLDDENNFANTGNRGGRQNPARSGPKSAPQSAPPAGNASPATHVWSAAGWQAANPNGNINAARAAAAAQGFQVVK